MLRKCSEKYKIHIHSYTVICIFHRHWGNDTSPLLVLKDIVQSSELGLYTEPGSGVYVSGGGVQSTCDPERLTFLPGFPSSDPDTSVFWSENRQIRQYLINNQKTVTRGLSDQWSPLSITLWVKGYTMPLFPCTWFYNSVVAPYG